MEHWLLQNWESSTTKLYLLIQLICRVQACSVTRSCATLCDPMGCSPPCSSVHGTLQEDYWSWLTFPPPGNTPDPGMEPESPMSPALQADSLPLSRLGSPVGRVHHVKSWAGWITSWNQDSQEKYQQPQICRWYHPNGRKQRGTKDPLDESETGEWKKMA